MGALFSLLIVQIQHSETLGISAAQHTGKKTTTLLLQHEDYVAHVVGAVQRYTWGSNLSKWGELNDD